jgi:MFS family permease
MLLVSPLAGRLSSTVGSRVPLLLGTFATTAAFVLLAVAHAHRGEVYLASALMGIGIGFAFSAMANLIVEAVRPDETGIATGMNTVMRTIGGVVGGQVGAALLVAHTIPGTNNVPSVDGFTIAFAIAAVVALLGALVAVFITPPRRRRREQFVVATSEASD